jgi:hypothetical protein
MPNSSPHLRSLHYDGCNDSDPFSDLPHRVPTQAPNNEHRNRRMNTRRLLESIPERERDMERDSNPECKIRARKGFDRRSGRPVMVFKRTGPTRKKQACGMPNCPTCGVFWRKCSSVSFTFKDRADLDQAWTSKISRSVSQVSYPSRLFPSSLP